LFFDIPGKKRFFEKSGTVAERERFSLPVKIPAEKLYYALAQHGSGTACCGRDLPEPGTGDRAKITCRFLPLLQ
jgi:hypothetical protein